MNRKNILRIRNKIFNVVEILGWFENKLRMGVNPVRLETQFLKEINQKLKELGSLEKNVKSTQEINLIKTMFRDSIKKYVLKSVFLKRGYLKPRGYPGDFRMLEAMYNDRVLSKGIGHLLDKLYLKNNYVQAVRERKDFLKATLIQYITNVNEKHVEILNLACGSCREIREMLEEGFFAEKKVTIYLVDQDEKAIQFAKKELRKLPDFIKLKYIKSDVLSFFKQSKRKFDFIYSIGLADYLPDSILGPMIRDGSSRLKSGGKFLLAHKNVKYYPSPASDWMCDWKFISRTEANLKKLIKFFLKDFKKGNSLKSIHGKSKLIFYFEIKIK